MRHALLWLALPPLGLASIPVAAQTAKRELHGVVFSVERGQNDRKYLPNVRVTVIEYGSADITNDQGKFRIQLPTGVLPGQDLGLPCCTPSTPQI